MERTDSLFRGKAGSRLFRATGTKFTTAHFESVLIPKQKNRYDIYVVSIFLVGEDGFEPSKS